MFDVASKNKALMRRIYEEMWNGGNPAVARQLFMSPEGVERFVGQFLSAFADLRHTVEEMIAEGDRIAVRFSAQGTHSGLWRGYAPTGRRIRYTGVTLARIVNDKIVEHETWWDRAGLIEQVTRDANP